jgi:acetyl-CoA carboxylase biotin carboxylase subunit
MRRAGLPVILGSGGTLPNIAAGLALASEIGFPVLLKATAGGGGRGMRRVDAAGEFAAKYQEASLEAENAFGDGRLYLEKYIARGRHIEFQVMADAEGNVVHLGERECSAQRRHQKLVEESPSPVLNTATRDSLGARICAALRAAGYRNAGTVEFLRDVDGHLYFMEINARLQVEHPVTEMVTGHDLVAEQIRLAANEPLSYGQDDVVWRGHAIECRINAEDAFDGFRPSPGLITRFEPPREIHGVEVRLDSHVQPQYRIPAHYDSLLGKLIVKGGTRELARAGMIRALESFRIEGVKTTIPAHLKIMADADFVAGNYDTSFVDRLLG